MRKRNQLVLFLLITLVYICTVFLLPTDPATLHKYNLTQTQARLLNLTVVIPLVAVWLSAFYGYITFRNYAESIKTSDDGEVLYKLSTGLMVLAFSLPTLGLVGSVFSYFAVNHTDYLQAGVILRQVLAVGFPLVAFIMISNATELLARQVKHKTNFLQNHRLLALAIIAASSLFSWITISLMDDNAAPRNIYSFPEWVVVLTVIIPYLYLWYRGLTAVYNLVLYRRYVKGHLYKRSFGYLAFGLGAVIVLAILIQIATVLTPQLQRLHFTPLLFIVYGLIALYALGYGMIAVGAKKLTKIEEV